MKLTQEQLIAIRKKKGLLNISSLELSKKVGISRETLRFVLRGKDNVQTRTYNKLINWLIEDI
ncbi:helix-turn-helix domain-containing protein [Ligilactobacillus agilis]|uniref:helix-turn-helix domain-containing protein n=1 Tax=Ligilactobacillus agilis TaxID=1601 RepID=UPI003F8A37CF